MLILDTDHFTVFCDERDPRHQLLNSRMEASDEPTASTIVSIEEVLRGWLAFIHRTNVVHKQLPAYARLSRLLDALKEWDIVSFDKRAADQFFILRRQKIRIGSMDLKIASIALVNNARLVTSNLRDFSLIPNLHCENWLRD